MGKVKTVPLRSVISLFFVCSITLVHAKPFAAEPAHKAEGVSFEVLNPEAEMIMASDISLTKTDTRSYSDKSRAIEKEQLGSGLEIRISM